MLQWCIGISAIYFISVPSITRAITEIPVTRNVGEKIHGEFYAQIETFCENNNQAPRLYLTSISDPKTHYYLHDDVAKEEILKKTYCGLPIEATLIIVSHKPKADNFISLFILPEEYEVTLVDYKAAEQLIKESIFLEGKVDQLVASQWKDKKEKKTYLDLTLTMDGKRHTFVLSPQLSATEPNHAITKSCVLEQQNETALETGDYVRIRVKKDTFSLTTSSDFWVPEELILLAPSERRKNEYDQTRSNVSGCLTKVTELAQNKKYKQAREELGHIIGERLIAAENKRIDDMSSLFPETELPIGMITATELKRDYVLWMPPSVKIPLGAMTKNELMALSTSIANEKKGFALTDEQFGYYGAEMARLSKTAKMNWTNSEKEKWLKTIIEGRWNLYLKYVETTDAETTTETTKQADMIQPWVNPTDTYGNWMSLVYELSAIPSKTAVEFILNKMKITLVERQKKLKQKLTRVTGLFERSTGILLENSFDAAKVNPDILNVIDRYLPYIKSYTDDWFVLCKDEYNDRNGCVYERDVLGIEKVIWDHSPLGQYFVRDQFHQKVKDYLLKESQSDPMLKKAVGFIEKEKGVFEPDMSNDSNIPIKPNDSTLTYKMMTALKQSPSGRRGQSVFNENVSKGYIVSYPVFFDLANHIVSVNFANIVRKARIRNLSEEDCFKEELIKIVCIVENRIVGASSPTDAVIAEELKKKSENESIMQPTETMMRQLIKIQMQALARVRVYETWKQGKPLTVKNVLGEERDKTNQLFNDRYMAIQFIFNVMYHFKLRDYETNPAVKSIYDSFFYFSFSDTIWNLMTEEVYRWIGFLSQE